MLEAAQQRVRDGISKRQFALNLGITEGALRKRLKLRLGRFIPVFTTEQSEELARHYKDHDKAFYGMTLNDLRSLAFQFAEENNIPHEFDRTSKMAGRDWASRFMKTHHLSLRTPQQTSLARIMGFNKQQIKAFFANLSKLKQQHKFPPHRQYNMDETGMSTVPNCPPKVIASTGKKSVGKVSSAERGELTTAVCAMSASGNYVAPVLIFKRKRQNPQLLNGAPPGTIMLVTDTGYINGDLFLEWLKHFQNEVKATKEDPVLLVMDNHSSHRDLRAIPPHSSHKTQPLDRCFFKALKTHFSEACSTWLTNNPGRVITQYQIAELFGVAYCKCATVDKAVTAFKTCGIEPLNPEVFKDDDFQPSLVTDIPQASNESNAHSDLACKPSTSYATPQANKRQLQAVLPVYAAPDPLPMNTGEEDQQMRALDL
ncbi:uncharacterized protein LOC135703202, partial [Ochlerotatus camptorhynchus]|uniref:uncharacterized protein LOC135703202 n=1 Tax=Ochlerotatus camptorhynchus TaxID=644619 RepID=UPI0031DDDA97